MVEPIDQVRASSGAGKTSGTDEVSKIQAFVGRINFSKKLEDKLKVVEELVAFIEGLPPFDLSKASDNSRVQQIQNVLKGIKDREIRQMPVKVLAVKVSSGK